MAIKAFSGGEKLEARLKELAAKVTNASDLHVGFLEGATYPDGGLNVPTVAIINEFGAPSRGQPPRPFFRTMIAKESKHWGDDVGQLLLMHDYNAETALNLLGEDIKGALKQSINDLTSPPLAPSTVERKGFEKPLIDTAHMINSIDCEVV